MKKLAWLLLLPGFLCNPENPLIIRPDSLFTWKGSCVLIPCEIERYQGASLRDIALQWYFLPFNGTNQPVLLYNSLSISRKIKWPSPSGSQLQFVGNLERKSCSLKISQVRTEDSGIYEARLNAKYSLQRGKWSLNATIHVAESPPEPMMDMSLKASQMTVVCSVPYHCPEERLQLVISVLGVPRLSSQETIYGTSMIQAFLRFQLTSENHGKTLLCSLQRENGFKLSDSTLQLDEKSHLPHATSTPAVPGPEPTTKSVGPQTSPPPPSTTKSVSSPVPSTSCPPSQSEQPPSCGPFPPLPSSQTPCDGRTLWEEFGFLNELQNQAVKTKTQFIHSCSELKSAVVHLMEKFRKALLQIRQRTCVDPCERKKQ